MEELRYQEYNKLIAAFVDYKATKNILYENYKTPFDKSICAFFISDAKFHKKWDWLMPIVEKIESMYDDSHGHFGVHISSNSCSIQGTKFRVGEQNSEDVYAYYTQDHGKDKLEATYIAVVNFIIWYNADIRDKLGG